jgi:RhoGAP domain
LIRALCNLIKNDLPFEFLKVQATLDDFRASADDPIPVFLKKAISFIEKEGLDAEGLYRVPGNRAHVELLFQVKIFFILWPVLLKFTIINLQS